MAVAIVKVYPSFDGKQLRALGSELESLELKPRVRRVRDKLRALLPSDYSSSLKILLNSAQNEDLNGFDLWPYSEFVQTYGLEDLEISLDALRDLTPKFSSEFAIRPFLRLHCKSTLKYLSHCASSPDVHIRRWASEGTRPRLPWGERLSSFVLDPSPTLKILEKLKWDPELYVRKSVANHLNDIAKDHPECVVQVLRVWKRKAKNSQRNNLDWIIRQALRTLIKGCHPEALELIDVSKKPKIDFLGLTVSQKSVKTGEKISFSFKVRSLSDLPQKLVIDYIVHFARPKQKTSAKVFKLKTAELPPRAEWHITKSHSLKRITTRQYYPGRHRVEVQINGKVLGETGFSLLED